MSGDQGPPWASHFARRDLKAVSCSVLIHLAILWGSKLTPAEHRRLVTFTAALLAALLLNIRHRRRYLRVRAPLIAAIRTMYLLFPVIIVDTVRGTRASGDAGGEAHTAASLLRASALVLTELAWTPACIASAVGCPLPPLLHAVLHSAGVGLLMRRAPAACGDFVAQHPSNAAVVRMMYAALRQAASLLCVGTREHLAAAGQAASAACQCTVVVWALEASLALVLPTLIIWQQQLVMARQAAGALGRREQRQGYGEAGEGEQGAAPAGRYAWRYAWPGTAVGGSHLRLLEAAEGASWPLAVGGSALAAFVAGVVWQSTTAARP